MVLEETKGKTIHHKPPAFSGLWSASQLRCERYCYLIARGIEGDFVESAVLQEGQLHEDDVIAKMTAKGLVVTDRQQLLRHPSLPLEGHPDGRFVVAETTPDIRMPPGRYLLDVKSMDRSFYYKAVKDFIGNFPHLYRQLESYSLMSEDHEPIFVPVKNRASGEIHEIILDPDEAEWAEIEAMVARLDSAIHTQDFNYMDLHCPSADSIAGKYCPYRAVGLCEHQTNIPNVTEAQVVQALSDYEEGMTLEKMGGERKSVAKGIMVAYLKNHKVTRMKIGDKTPTIAEGSRRSCNFDKLKETAPKIYDDVVSMSDYDKFEIR